MNVLINVLANLFERFQIFLLSKIHVGHRISEILNFHWSKITFVDLISHIGFLWKKVWESCCTYFSWVISVLLDRLYSGP